MQAFRRFSRWLGAGVVLLAFPVAVPMAGCSGDVSIGEQQPPGPDASGGQDSAAGDSTRPGTDGSGGGDTSTGGYDTGSGGDDTGTGGDAPAVDSAGDGCVDTIFCTLGTHWDPQLCTCVPDDGGIDRDGCGIPVPCPSGAYFDPQTCMCVYIFDGGPCISARGGPCGGFTSNPCRCMPGLTCVYEAGIPDLAGTCQ
jgi:hypothetical protein